MTSWTPPGGRGRAAGVGLRSAVACSLTLPGALGAAWLSFGFGVHLGGALMGTVAAANGALFSAVLIGALVDRVWPARRSAAT